MSVPAPTSEQRRRRTSRWPTIEEREMLLQALSSGWTVRHSAMRAGLTRQRFYDLRDADHDFAAQWEQALEAGLEALIDEVRRRAVDGWDEPIYQKGELVGHVRRYSDNLLMFLTKQRDPSFRENHRIELAGTIETGITVKHEQGLSLVDVMRLSQSLGDNANKAVIDGLIAALQRRGELTPEAIDLLNSRCQQAAAPLALPPGDPA